MAHEDAGDAAAVRFQRDLYLYWRVATTSDGLALTTRGYVSRPALRRVRQRLALFDGASLADTDGAEGDDLRLFYLRRLLERLGLLRRSAESTLLVAVEEREMRRYLAHPLAERLRICARLWVAGGWWPDRLEPRSTPPGIMAPAPPRVAVARRRLIEAVIAMPAGAYGQIPAAATGATKRTPPGRPSRSHEASRGHVATADESETWRAALLGPLAWMGFVVPRTAPAPREPGAYEAGTPLAALRAAVDEVHLDERPGRVVIQPNFSLIAYPPLTAPELARLDLCADETQAGQIAQYQLTRTAFARARAAGWSVEQLVSQLEALAGTMLPSNVRVTLDDWDRHVERIRLTPEAVLLEVRGAALLDLLLIDRSASGWIERRLTPTAALVAASAVERLRAWLLARGELPAFVQHTPAGEGGSQ